jgi:hypothetical protein
MREMIPVAAAHDVPAAAATCRRRSTAAFRSRCTRPDHKRRPSVVTSVSRMDRGKPSTAGNRGSDDRAARSSAVGSRVRCCAQHRTCGSAHWITCTLRSAPTVTS